jgi:hypothetical protein
LHCGGRLEWRRTGTRTAPTPEPLGTLLQPRTRTGDWEHFGLYDRQEIAGVLILTPAEYSRSANQSPIRDEGRWVGCVESLTRHRLAPQLRGLDMIRAGWLWWSAATPQDSL